MTAGEKEFILKESYFVDSTFLQIFDFKLLKGNRTTALQKPNSAVLNTSKLQKNYLAKKTLLEKQLHIMADDTTSFIVTGILENVPQNSQMQFDALYSFSSILPADGCLTTGVVTGLILILN